MPYCPPMSFWDELFSNCTGGFILNHKRTLIAEIRAAVRGRLDQFKELEHSEIIGTIAQSAKEVLSPEQGAAVKIFGVGRGGGSERTSLPIPRLNKLLDFWTTLFERSGAVPVTISQNLVAD